MGISTTPPPDQFPNSRKRQPFKPIARLSLLADGNLSFRRAGHLLATDHLVTKYLRDARGFNIRQMVLFASLPYIGSFLSSLVFGFLSDRIGRGALLCTMSLTGAATSIGLAALVSEPIVSGLLMTRGTIMRGMGTPVYSAIMQRIVPRPHHSHRDRHRQRTDQFWVGDGACGHRFPDCRHEFLPGRAALHRCAGLIGAAGAAVLAMQRY